MDPRGNSAFSVVVKPQGDTADTVFSDSQSADQDEFSNMQPFDDCCGVNARDACEGDADPPIALCEVEPENGLPPVSCSRNRASFAAVEQINRDLTSRSLCASVAVVVATSLLHWTLSLVLTSAGLLTALLYRQSFAWDDVIGSGLLFALVGGIFTAWNVAQYASYAIQTTGHASVRQHLRAVVRVGPLLLCCNGIGWTLGVVLAATSAAGDHVVPNALLMGAPPVLCGILAKTFGKGTYLLQHLRATTGVPPHEIPTDDSLGKRLREEHLQMGTVPKCPFKSLSPTGVVHQARGPLACALWTAVYVVALRVANCWAAQQAGALKLVLQFCLFSLALSVFLLGEALLAGTIARSQGYMGYNDKMVLAFYLIYFMVSDVQVRLGVVQMDGLLRMFCTFMQPAVFTFLRFRSTRAWKALATKARLSPSEQAARPRLVIACVISMLTQNISATLVSGIACVFQGVDGVHLGTCEKPMLTQIAMDSSTTWLLDCVGFAGYVKLRLPAAYVFTLLDPFLVVAAVVVVYLNVMLALLTGIITV